MSVDVTSPDVKPIRARRRSRGARSATFSPALPTLLRVPDVRPPSRVDASEGGPSSVKLVVGTAPPVNEPWAAHLSEEHTETTMPRDPLDAQASIDARGSERIPSVIAGNATWAELKGKAIDAMQGAMRGFGKKWSSQLGTWGAIATAVIACTLVARAMKQDDFDATPLPELMVMSEKTASGAGAEQKDIEVTNLDAGDDRIAIDTSTSVAGLSTESISGGSHLTQGAMHGDSYYANSHPFVGATGPTQDPQRPSAPTPEALESALPSDSPQPGVAANSVAPHPMLQSPWASSPTEPQTRYALDQPLPQSPLEGSVAPPDGRDLDPNVTPVVPSNAWPTPIVSDNDHAHMQSSTPRTVQYSANTVASSPQSPSGYPTTDQSRYGSFGDLKRALIERKLERDPYLHISDSRPLMRTRNPSDATGNLGTEAVYNRSGVYR